MGMWIETSIRCRYLARRSVTPCMGVWIETLVLRSRGSVFMSHPVWVCGLKQMKKGITIDRDKSHPVWVCGLKHVERIDDAEALVSHPVWVCGLKQRR